MVYLTDYECIVKKWKAFFISLCCACFMGCEEKLSKYCKKIIDLNFSEDSQKIREIANHSRGLPMIFELS